MCRGILHHGADIGADQKYSTVMLTKSVSVGHPKSWLLVSSGRSLKVPNGAPLSLVLA